MQYIYQYHLIGIGLGSTPSRFVLFPFTVPDPDPLRTRFRTVTNNRTKV